MNSTTLYIEASEAIGEFYMRNHGPCLLSYEKGKVMCRAVVPGDKIHDNTLLITKYEVHAGMKQARWNAIGTELHNQLCKGKACQANSGKSK